MDFNRDFGLRPSSGPADPSSHHQQAGHLRWSPLRRHRFRCRPPRPPRPAPRTLVLGLTAYSDPWTTHSPGPPAPKGGLQRP